MLSDEQKERLHAFLEELTSEQQQWLAGYLAGRLSLQATGSTTTDATTVTNTSLRVPIYFATETGNGKAIALATQKALRATGVKASNLALHSISIDDLEKVELAVFICSTHGEGDPPEACRSFFKTLATAELDLSGLQYRLLGLGDRAYASFCGAALQLHERLQTLGAKALAEPTLLDVDFANHVPSWIQQTVDALAQRETRQPTATPQPTLTTVRGTNRLDPVTATVKLMTDLNDEGSDRKTVHIELTPEVPLVYAPGDSVGIVLDDDPDPPRLYSIASSPEAHPDEIHLTVVLETFQLQDGSTGYGKCSQYLCNLRKGDSVRLYVHANHMFNLPQASQDAIMIGPGTGVAPFRSFVYERMEQGHQGRNWLIFGNPKQQLDFLYQSEWQEHLATDALHKISLAFSRDQPDKIYVQHRLREEADTLRTWVEGGAAIYLCGSKSPMGDDVELTLAELLGEERLQQMLTNETYIKEVY